VAGKTWLIILTGLVVIIALIGVTFSGPIGNKIQQAEATVSKVFHHALDKSMYEGFKQTADKLNKRGPVMVSKHLRLDKTDAGPGARITYFYSFTNHAASDFTPNKLNTNLQEKIDKSVCSNMKIKPSLELGATYVFAYSGNDGVEITRITVNKDNCTYK